jgi:hypoxanthine phosphoribosyltransferase
MGSEIAVDLQDKNPIAVCVLLGSVVPFGKLLTRLNFPLHIDYVHATRYRHGLEGKDLHWIAKPVLSAKNRTVLIVDDILDEGTTLAAIESFYHEQGAEKVYKAVLVKKDRPRAVDIAVDYVGLEVPDRYVFGCGMDYKGYWRNLSGIYAAGD